MEWVDDAIILGARRHGEHDAIIDVLTQDFGRFRGFLRAGTGKKLRGIIQMGNHIHATWRSRVEENLGTMSVEIVTERASLLFSDQQRLAAMTNATSLVAAMLPEREAAPQIFGALTAFLDVLIEDGLSPAEWGQVLIKFEMGLLQNLGYGLDLSCCASTGQIEDLIYVSPKSGRAVSAEAGLPFHDKLLTLPSFLVSDKDPSESDIYDALVLTGYFLQRHILSITGGNLPESRYRLTQSFKTEAIK